MTWLLILLLPAVPAGFVIKYSNQTPAATFMSNLVAMVPLPGSHTDVADRRNDNEKRRSRGTAGDRHDRV